jgi:hypothetical protein
MLHIYLFQCNNHFKTFKHILYTHIIRTKNGQKQNENQNSKSVCVHVSTKVLFLTIATQICSFFGTEDIMCVEQRILY